MGSQFRKALLGVWLILSLVALGVLSAPFVLSEEGLLSLGRSLQEPGHDEDRCVLCGMTRAFAAIGRGDFERARTLNGAALPLYGVLAGNEIVAGAYLTLQARKRRERQARKGAG